MSVFSPFVFAEIGWIVYKNETIDIYYGIIIMSIMFCLTSQGKPGKIWTKQKWKGGQSGTYNSTADEEPVFFVRKLQLFYIFRFISTS